MRKPGLTTIGFGLVGIGSSLFAAPASAAISCGTAPTGGTLTQSGDYCQLKFATPGDYSFTVPSSASQLFALVVGGGAGGYIQGNGDGYAGSAGKVHYKDMSDSINTPLSIHIGTGGPGGVDSGANGGTDSSVSAPATSDNAISFGASGSQTTLATQCALPGWGVFLSLGEGSRTQMSMNAAGDSCINGQGAGVNPHVGNVDSDGHATPTIFRDLNTTYGTGGSIVVAPTALPTVLAGDGGSLQATSTPATWNAAAASGGNGLAILRWKSGGLANTGSDSVGTSALAAGLILAGTGLVVASRKRRTVSK